MISSATKREKAVATMFVAALAFISLLSFASQVYARVSTQRGDEVVENAAALDAVAFNMTLANLSAATSTGLVDLSDTTNFKHVASSGAVEVFKLRFDWQTNGTASTTLRVGVVASTTPSGNLSDIYWFETVSFASDVTGAANQRQTKEINYLPALFNARVASGVPSAFVTNTSDTSSTKYATTTKYTSPRGSFTMNPGVGDLVMEVFSQTGGATTTVSGLYRVTE